MKRFALVGLGHAGLEHLAAMRTVTGLDLVGACDLSPERIAAARARFNDLNYYANMVEMFEEQKPDAVAVVTNAAGHHPVSLAAIRKGIHVIVEKPLASDTAQGEEIVKAARAAGVLLAVTFTYRFVPETRRIHELIRSGNLGQLLSVRYVRLGGPARRPPEGTEKREMLDGRNRPGEWGHVYDCGVHAFDLFQWWADSTVEHVEAVGRCVMGYDYPDSLTAVLRFKNHVKAVYDDGAMPHMSPGPGKPGLFYLEATLTAGSLLYRFGEPDGQGGLHSVLYVADSSGVRPEIFPIYSKMRDLQYRQFLKSITTGRLGGYFGAPEEAVRAGEIAERVLEASLANLIPPPRWADLATPEMASAKITPNVSQKHDLQ